MRQFLLFLSIFLFACSIIAQPQRGLKGNYNVNNYPEVTFIWNTADPNILDKTMFTLTDENGKNIDFNLLVLPPEKKTFKKSVLFLWEDMKSHSNQSENTRNLLVDFFNKTSFDQSTEFNVAVFNRKSDYEDKVLKPLVSNFTLNTDMLASLVAEYETSSRIYKENPIQTDLYMAINEGITMLKAEPSDRVGIIVVVTAGLNMKAAGATTEMATVRENATAAGIPIYVVKYHQLKGNAPEVNSLAESTYGKTLLMTNNMVDKTVVELQDLYNKLDATCAGRDYKFTFTTTAPRDGKPHRLNLLVNKVSQPTLQFTAPSMTFGLWVQEHLILFIFLVILLIALIATSVWFIVRSIKNRKRREAENNAQLQQKIDKANQERQQWENMQSQKEEEKRQMEEHKARIAEENKLLDLMQTKNMFPRLQCHVDGNTFSYSISQVVTKIGRNESNDVVLSSNTVSGFHAEIVFNGASFELVNRSKSYTRGVIVNGQFFQQCPLKSGDMIGLGEAVVSFYV
jgi:cytoskeletal protein RodZ